MGYKTREDAIMPMVPISDHTQKQGFGVVLSGAGVEVCSSATVEPYGIILEGQNTNGLDSIAILAGGYKGTLRAKLSATPGTVVNGTNLVITTTGAWKADPATGGRVLCLMALETGAANALVECVPYKPQSAS